MEDKKVEKIINDEFSGLFARGDLDQHDRKLIQKWIDNFIKLYNGKEVNDESS